MRTAINIIGHVLTAEVVALGTGIATMAALSLASAPLGLVLGGATLVKVVVFFWVLLED